MGSSEAMRNLELLSLQYSAQRDWAKQAILTAMDGAAHFNSLAESYRCDCQEAMRARSSAMSYERAAAIFAGVVDDCGRVLAEIKGELAT